MTSPEIEEILEKYYRPGVQRAIRMVPIDKSPEDLGYMTNLTRLINKKSSKIGVPTHPQYVHAWLDDTRKKVQKGGLTMATQVGLGVGVGLSEDPRIAGAMLGLLLFGAWNPSQISVREMEKMVKSGFSQAATEKPLQAKSKAKPRGIEDSQMKTLQLRLETLEKQIAASAIAPVDPMTQGLRDMAGGKSVEEIANVARDIFSPALANRAIEIIKGEGNPIQSDDWRDVSYLLTRVTGKSVTVSAIRDLSRNALAAMSSIPADSLR